MDSNQKSFTPDQAGLVKQFCDTYGLSASQVNFEGDSLEPIFDYPALNILRLRLTDFIDVEPVICERNERLVTARCTITLADKRKAADLGTAIIGEKLYDGSEIADQLQAQAVALSRAFRRAIVAAGVNLLKAHNLFMENGEISTSAPINLPRKNQKEIHKLARQWGHDEKGYRNFLKNLFGVESSEDLDDEQMSQAIVTYRAMIQGRNQLAKGAA